MTIIDIEARYKETVSSGAFRQPSGVHEIAVMCSKCGNSYVPAQLSPLWYVAGWFADKYAGQRLVVDECYGCDPLQTEQVLWDVLTLPERVILSCEFHKSLFADLYISMAVGDQSSLELATRVLEPLIDFARCPVLLVATSHVLGPRITEFFQAFIQSEGASIRGTGQPFLIFEKLYIFILRHKGN